MNQVGLDLTTARPTLGQLARAQGRLIARYWHRYPTATIAVGILTIVLLAVILADVIAPFDPNKSISTRLLPPFADAKTGGTHILGTDNIGRDLFARILHGGRVSLMVGLVAPTAGITLGALMGITSAYFGGLVDLLLQRITDTLMAIPSLLLAMAVTISLGFTTSVVILAIGIAIVPYASRLLRAHVLVIRQAQYVEAARATGATNTRVIFRHLVPNSWAPWIVLLAVNVGNAIVIEASLSFLGIGIQPPTSSWGNLLISAANYFTENPHLVIAPGVAITIVVLCMNIFGDSLRDLLDPRLRGAD